MNNTSHKASQSIATTAPTLRRMIYAHLYNIHPEGATDEEMQIALKMTGNTQRPRRVELYNRGLVINSGVVRKTKSGKRAWVWKLPSRVWSY